MKQRILLVAIAILSLGLSSIVAQITAVPSTTGPNPACGSATGQLLCSACNSGGGYIVGWQVGSFTTPSEPIYFTGPDQSTNGPDHTFVSANQYPPDLANGSFQYYVPVGANGIVKQGFRAVYTTDNGMTMKYSWPIDIVADSRPSVAGTLSTPTYGFVDSGSGQLQLTGSFGTVQWSYPATPSNGSTTSFNITKTTSFSATVTNGGCPSAHSNVITVEIFKQGVLSGPATVAEGQRVELSLTEVYKSVVRWEYSIDGGTTWVNFDYNSYGHSVTGDKLADTHQLTATTQFRVLVDMGPLGQRYTNVVTVTPVGYTDFYKDLTNGGNYVREQKVTVPGITNPNAVDVLPVDQKHEVITYLDGLGRSVQQNTRNASPNLKNDMIGFSSNNYQGAQATQYLPYVSSLHDGAYRADPVGEQASFYSNGIGDKIADSAFPYATTIMEKSPLARVVEQGSVGQEFQPGSSHTQTAIYTNNDNTGNQVRLFQPDGSSNGFYDTNQLSSMIGADEDQKQKQTFIDKTGHTILTRVQLDATTWLETYYIYNNVGNVSYIISPKGTAVLRANLWSLTQSIKDQYVHQFIYDARGRLIEKKVPGQAWMYYCYDRLDRLVLMQDGNSGTNKWIFIKYDRRGRAVMQGLYTNTTYTTRATLQLNVVDPLYALSIDPYYEDRGATAHGYTNQSFPTSGTQIHAVNYYDDYDLTNNGTADDISYTSQGLPNENTPTNVTTGMPTVSKRLVLDGGTTWLYNYAFYDVYGRVIQTISNNHLSTTVDNMTTMVYDFEGKVMLTKNYHNAGTGKHTTVVNTFVYDAVGRLKQIKQNNNNATSDQLIAQYEYNELGQLVDKKLHSNDGTNFLQSIDYRYNLQGKLTSINNAQLTSDAIMNDDANDMFGMELMYQTTEAGLTTAGDVNYNGNISAVKWKGAGAISGATDQKSYKFSYDKSNKLTGATSQLYSGSAWNKEAGALNESMSYDYNGNILTLQRNQRKNLLLFDYTAENVDKLTYAYDPAMGDQLQQVTDAATGTAAAGFNNGNSGTANDYVYDLNGNVIKDLNKGISSIVYNHLGKPSTIIFSDGRHVDYVYDAIGTKLTMKVYNTSNVLQTTTDYVNGFVYENNTLSFFSSSEGRVVNNSGTLEYQYIIKDHQGNTRVVFSSQTPAPLTPTATFEGDSNDQSSEYLNAVSNVVSFGSANHTPGGSKVVRMNQTYKLGPAKSVSVFPGDKVDIEVWEYHESASGFGTSSTPLPTLITNLAAIYGGVSGGAGEAGLKYTGVNSAINTFGTGGNQGDSRPAAYLNYILFDKNYNVLDAGYQLAPGTTMTKQKLSFNTLNIKEPGYVYTYLSYDDDSNNWVYFDDFKVTHTKTNVIQYNEYYPYGLQANTSWTRDNNKNNFLYNEGSEINTTTNWYDLPYRNYDASLGRFMQVDPLATQYASFSGYHYSYNNPIMFSDPSGAGSNDRPYNYSPGGDPGGPDFHGPPPFEDSNWGPSRNGFNSISATWIDSNSNVIFHTNDDDHNIYYVSDPTNWKPGDTKGLMVVGLENPNHEYVVGEHLDMLNLNYNLGVMLPVVEVVGRGPKLKSSQVEDNFKWEDADNIGDMISSFVSIPALAGGIRESEIFKGAAKNAFKAYNIAYSESFQSISKYSKGLGAAGKILGITGIVTSFGELMQEDFSLTNLTKFGINVGSLFLKANPVGLTISLGVGILDYTGYLDKGLNYIYNEDTSK